MPWFLRRVLHGTSARRNRHHRAGSLLQKGRGGTMRRLLLFPCLTLLLPALASAGDDGVTPYRKLQLDGRFFAEGATFADLNNDGHPDAISGPYWWEGPDFKQRHEIYPALPFDPLWYSDHSFTFTYDFNGDGWIDVLV